MVLSLLVELSVTLIIQTPRQRTVLSPNEEVMPTRFGKQMQTVILLGEKMLVLLTQLVMV